MSELITDVPKSINQELIEGLYKKTQAMLDDSSLLLHSQDVSYLSNALKNLQPQVSYFELLALEKRLKESLQTTANADLKNLQEIVAQLLADIEQASNTQDEKIQLAGSRELNNINSATETNLATLSELTEESETSIKQLADNKTALIEEKAENILTAQQVGILPEARPFIFGVAEMYAGAGSSYTSELGQLYSNKGQKLFDLLTGIESAPKYNKWNKPPSIEFINGDTWHYSQQETQYASSGNLYNYPKFMLSALFVKNDTDQAITRALKRRYSSYSSGYAYAALYVGLLNEQTKEINWAAPRQYTGSSVDYSEATNVTVPANTTVVILSYNSAFYWTSSNGYQFVLRHAYELMNTFLSSGLSIDIEKTLKAMQLPAATPAKIWGVE